MWSWAVDIVHRPPFGETTFEKWPTSSCTRPPTAEYNLFIGRLTWPELGRSSLAVTRPFVFGQISAVDLWLELRRSSLARAGPFIFGQSMAVHLWPELGHRLWPNSGRVAQVRCHHLAVPGVLHSIPCAVPVQFSTMEGVTGRPTLVSQADASRLITEVRTRLPRDVVPEVAGNI